MNNDVCHSWKGDALVRVGESMKVEERNLVFDLDETLGSFGELYQIWRAFAVDLSGGNAVAQLLALYPEVLRYGMCTMLQYLQAKKKSGHLNKLFVYTNNRYGKEWVHALVHGIEEIAHTPNLFDQIVSAFKINNVVIEPNRTSYAKTWTDLIRCTMLPPTAQICFVDDSYFPQMKQERVYYIQPRPYTHALSMDIMVNRFIQQYPELAQSPSIDRLQAGEKRKLTNPHLRADLDIAVSKRIMYLLGDFFSLTLRKPKTRKFRGRFWFNRTQRNLRC